MPNLTVHAADTATAMDEIWEKLGPDAMVVSTTKRNGQIVMEATTDAPKKPAAPKAFTDIFTGQIVGKTGPKPDQDMPTTAHNKTDLSALRRDVAAIHDMLGGLVLTDLDGINPSLAGATRVQLQQAGFSSPLVVDLKDSYAGLDYTTGTKAFLAAIARRLAHSAPEAILTKRLIFVTGTSGTGRTTMVAKLAAMLREAHPTKEIVLASLDGRSAVTNHALQNFGRLLNMPVCTLDLDTPVQDFNKMTDYDMMVLDVTALPDEACAKINAIKAHLGAPDVGVVTTIPGSASGMMITLTLERFNSVDPLLTLTKLDECETTVAEFSVFAEHNAKIGMLSGTKSIIGAAMFASETILLQYLKENFNVRQNRPISGPHVG